MVLISSGWWRVIFDEYTRLRWWRVEYTPCNAPSTKIDVVARSLWDIRTNPQDYLPGYTPTKTYMRISSIANPHVPKIKTPKTTPTPRPAGAGKRGPLRKPYVATNPTPSKNPNKVIPVATIDGVEYKTWHHVMFHHHATRGMYMRCVTDFGIGNVTSEALKHYAATVPQPVVSW